MLCSICCALGLESKTPRRHSRRLRMCYLRVSCQKEMSSQLLGVRSVGKNLPRILVPVNSGREYPMYLVLLWASFGPVMSIVPCGIAETTLDFTVIGFLCAFYRRQTWPLQSDRRFEDTNGEGCLFI